MSEQMQDGLTSYERSVQAERTLCDAILDAIDTRMSYTLDPRGIYDQEYALEEASEWIELIVKRQIRASRETLWCSRIAPARERSRSLRMAARAAAAVTTQTAQQESHDSECVCDSCIEAEAQRVHDRVATMIQTELEED